MFSLLLIVGIGVLGVLIYVSIYNGLVQLRQNVYNGWAQIDVQLKRRHDLIPNLVETAKGYLQHERQTLENVTKARQMAVDAKGVADREAAENMLTSTLRSLFAVSENYPQLKADQNMIRLQEELTTTENKIAFARQYYNDEVNRYNVATQKFPDAVVAGMAGFKPEFFFKTEEADKAVPEVKF
ncbi:MAG: LemA family protein [Candidatus Omnitrophica bacterium]|nr:LemA family protein [Candidatus Omnitrophota bacterium]